MEPALAPVGLRSGGHGDVPADSAFFLLSQRLRASLSPKLQRPRLFSDPEASAGSSRGVRCTVRPAGSVQMHSLLLSSSG